MTPKQINDLKIKFNAMHEEGRVLYNRVEAITKKMQSITETLIEAEGEDYDGVPLIFGAGYWIDPALVGREHITDGTPCWCNPETTYTDPDTGVSVIVHKEPQ
jgi:hypothetical protein